MTGGSESKSPKIVNQTHSPSTSNRSNTATPLKNNSLTFPPPSPLLLFVSPPLHATPYVSHKLLHSQTFLHTVYNTLHPPASAFFQLPFSSKSSSVLF